LYGFYILVAWLDRIGENGALERYFRLKGKYGDGVGVIPIDIGNKLRLYYLRISDKILIFSSGGIKDASSWQNSETLAPYMEMLIGTSRFVASRIKNGKIILEDKELIGNLNFTRYENE